MTVQYLCRVKKISMTSNRVAQAKIQNLTASWWIVKLIPWNIIKSESPLLTQIKFGTQWPSKFCAVDIFAVPTQFFLVILCGITNSRHVFEAVATLFIYNREPPWLMTVALALYHLHWLCCPCYLPYSRKSSLYISPMGCYFHETDLPRGCICKR